MGEADFLIYLSELLVESGKQVVVVDGSLEKDIFALLPVSEKEHTFTYHGVEYQRDLWKGEEPSQIFSYYCTFDIVFFIVGTEISNKERLTEYPAEVWYIFLTANRRGIEKTKQIVWEEKVPVFLFIRDFCDYKITASYIRNLWREARGKIDGWYEIPFDIIDYEYAVRMQYEPVNEYKQLSKEMQEVLVTVASKLTGLTKKEEAILYKKIKRGKKRCK